MFLLLYLVLLVKLFIPTSTTPFINVKNMGAQANGISDDSQIINDAIQSVSTDGVVFLPKGNYLISKPITLKSNVILRGEGPDSTIITQDTSVDWTQFPENGLITTSPQLFNEQIVISGLSVVGCYGSDRVTNKLMAKGGICMRNCKSTTVRNVKTSSTWHGVAFYDYKYTDVSSFDSLVDVTVTDAIYLTTNNNQGRPRGIMIGTPGCYLENCQSIHSGTGFLVSEENCEMYNCAAINSITDNGYYILANNFFIKDSKAIDINGSGFTLAYNKGGSIQNCLAKGCTNFGFRIHVPESNCKISNNTALECGIGFGIDNTSKAYPLISENIFLDGNKAESCLLQGFLLRQVQNSVFTNNVAINNNRSPASLSNRGGIALKEYCISNDIENNVCNDTQNVKTQIYGIYNYNVSTSHDNKIVHQSISGIDVP